MSKLRLHGTSSGYTDIAPTAAAGNNTLTAPTGTGTLVAEDSNGDISVNLGIVHTGDTDTKIKFPAANTITAETGGSEALRIDSAGRVQIGNTSSIVGGRVELHRASAGTWITINESSDSGSGPALYLNRTRGSDLSSPTAATSGNWLGNVYFGSYDTNSYEQGAKISAAADSNWADGDCPARLMFYTTPDGSTTPTERLRIDSSGNLTAVNTASGGQSVTLKVGASNASGVNAGTVIINNGGTGDASLQFDYEGSAARAKIWVYRSDQQLRFDTGGSERLRIGSSGQLGIGGANYGTSGQVLTSGGSGSAPSWASAAGGIEISHQWRLTSSATGNQTPLTGWELVDTYGGGGFGTAMSESSGIFTFPSTGWWLISFQLSGYSDNSSQNVIGQIETTTDNSSYTHTALGQQGIYDFNNSYPSHALVFTQALFDVTNTSTHKCRFGYGAGQGNESVKGSSTYSYTNVIFTRLGDT